MNPDTRALLGLSTSGASGSHNIRELLDSLIFKSTPRHCEYILYRRFDTSQLTEYWDAEKEEAIGGYKHPYTDSLILARTSWYARGSDQEELEAIGLNANAEPYAHLRYDANPKREDIIFMLREQPASATMVDSVIIQAQYNITRVVNYKDIDGRVEYYTCLLKEELRDDYR